MNQSPTINKPVAAPVVADHIEALKPYIPGKPIEQVKRELGLTDVIKLASNENPLGPSPAAVEAMRSSAPSVALYPEGDAPALREAVAAHLGVPGDHLVFGNGSDEVLHLLTMTYLQPGDHTVQGDPSFAMYEIYTQQCNATPIKVPLTDYTHNLSAMLDALTPKTRIIFIANPNNPTGTLVRQPEVTEFLDRVPEDVLVVFDEAYDEYVDDPQKPKTLPYVLEGRNVIVLRTFSKAYGLAGLRVGYGVARPEIAAMLNKVRSPFNVNLIAQHAAAVATLDQDHIRKAVALNATGRDYLYREFARMGLDYVPSQANFVLVDIAGDSRQVFADLQAKGVIIRPGAGLGLPRHIRVTVGTQAQNERFIKALGEVLGK